MSSSSSGSLMAAGPLMIGPVYFWYDRSVLRERDVVKSSPPLPSEVLAELLLIVAEISSVLDPEALLPTIARQIKRIVDYKFIDIFLVAPDGALVPARAEGDSPESVARV